MVPPARHPNCLDTAPPTCDSNKKCDIVDSQTESNRLSPSVLLAPPVLSCLFSLFRISSLLFSLLTSTHSHVCRFRFVTSTAAHPCPASVSVSTVLLQTCVCCILLRFCLFSSSSSSITIVGRDRHLATLPTAVLLRMLRPAAHIVKESFLSVCSSFLSSILRAASSVFFSHFSGLSAVCCASLLFCQPPHTCCHPSPTRLSHR